MPGSAEDLIARALSAALDGDPAPAAEAFAAKPWLRRDLLKALLSSTADAPVAAVFAVIWADIAAALSPDLINLLRWYLGAEAQARLPARAAVQRAALTRLFALPSLPATEAGFDLAFAAIRAALDRPAPMALLALANAAMDRTAAAWEADPARLPGTVMLYAAQGLLRTDLIRRWLDRLPAARPLAPDLQRAIDWALDQMIEFRGEADPWLSAWILADHAADPAAPGAARRRAWLALQREEGLARVDALLRGMRVDQGDAPTQVALKFAYWTAWTNEMNDLAAWASALLDGFDPAWRPAELRAAPDPAAEAALAPPPPGEALDVVLHRGLMLAESDLALDRPPSPQSLRQAFRDLVRVADAAAVPADWTLAQFAEAAHQLRHLTQREFAWAVHFPDAPHTTGAPQYGLADLAKMPAMDAGFLDLAKAFCRLGLAWAEAGHEIRGLWALARILQIHTDCAIRLGRADLAQAFQARLRATGLLPEALAIEADTLRLAIGAADDAVHPPPGPRQGTRVHPFLDRADWTLAEGIAWTRLADDPAVSGAFGVYWPDGRCETYPHSTHARSLSLARVPGAGLMAEGLVFGPGGHVLRPDPYHTSRDYPRHSTSVVAGQWGQLRLRPSGEAHVDRPVLLLEACAALYWPNYFHWMIPHLARIALALDQGLLADRALVLPEGLRPWMLETLDLVGLAPDRRLHVPIDRLTWFADALLLGSIEHPSAAAIGALRGRVLGAGAGAWVGAAAPPADGPFYFLSRRSRNLRKMLNEEEVEEIARGMGFTLITPEAMPVAEQARLFAGARGIAGPEGAALTNTLFSAPGTRVLAIVCANDMMPVFNDLSLVMGHEHRKLAGQGVDSAGGTRFQPAFAVDPDRARQALAWVMEGR